MPTKDIRTRTGTDLGKDQGRKNVNVALSNGKRMVGTVIGQGTSSGLKIMIRNSNTHQILDNVPQRTAQSLHTLYYEYRTQ